MFYFPSSDINDWKNLLVDPQKQWVPGYSAYELAHAWNQSDQFPESINNLFENSTQTIFKNLQIILKIPEHKVYLDTRKAPSQNDLFVLGRIHNDLLTIMVEGKVKESFDKKVEDWSNNASEGKKKRLSFLMDCLELQKPIDLSNIRYQLLHRTASAILEAQKYHSKHALMLVHSFCLENSHFKDYEEFVRLFHLYGKKNNISEPININGINLYLGWVSDAPKGS